MGGGVSANTWPFDSSDWERLVFCLFLFLICHIFVWKKELLTCSWILQSDPFPFPNRWATVIIVSQKIHHYSVWQKCHQNTLRQKYHRITSWQKCHYDTLWETSSRWRLAKPTSNKKIIHFPPNGVTHFFWLFVTMASISTQSIVPNDSLHYGLSPVEKWKQRNLPKCCPQAPFLWISISLDKIFGDHPLSSFTFDLCLGTSWTQPTAEEEFTIEPVSI